MLLSEHFQLNKLKKQCFMPDMHSAEYPSFGAFFALCGFSLLNKTVFAAEYKIHKDYVSNRHMIIGCLRPVHGVCDQ